MTFLEKILILLGIKKKSQATQPPTQPVTPTITPTIPHIPEAPLTPQPQSQQGVTTMPTFGVEPGAPYENTIAKNGSPTWPNQNTPASALVKGGLGTRAAPQVIKPGDAPASIFMQNWIKTGFIGDSWAQYSSGGIIDTIIVGGQGGCTGMDFYISKTGDKSAYQGGVNAHGIRSIADGRNTNHYDGILAGIWGGVYSHTDKTAAGIATAQENNAFTMFKWNPDNAAEYVGDVFNRIPQHTVLGLLINNYQQGVTDTGGVAGDYQNTFGIGITSVGAGGRGFGYQTGIYITDSSQEALRIRSGVIGTDKRTKFGIKFDGPSCSVAGIALGDNKINWGGHSGGLQNNGDMFYNNVNGALYMLDTQGQKEVLKTPSDPIRGSGQASHKIKVNINGKDYYLLAAES